MSLHNPQSQRPKPPFPEQPQTVPGLESQMNPKPDYGEDSYSVAPEPVWTPLIPSTMPSNQVTQFGKGNAVSAPMERPAQPAELAPVYVLLASDDGSYISGVTVPVTGGFPVVP